MTSGTWQNPADAPGAQAKLSRPRVHGDNPDLYRATEKLRGGCMAEARAHRAYSQRLRDRKRTQGP